MSVLTLVISQDIPNHNYPFKWNRRYLTWNRRYLTMHRFMFIYIYAQ